MKAKALIAWVTVSATVGSFCLLSACSTSSNMVKAQNMRQRASIRRVAEMALAELYRAKPGTRSVVVTSVGYAIFSDFGFRSILMKDARAMGVAADNATGRETFMKMVQIHSGPGANAGKFRMVLVFETEEAFNTFTKSAWILGPDVMAAAIPDDRTGPFGGAMLLKPGMHAFQLDEHGVIVGLSVRDVMFYRDRELQ